MGRLALVIYLDTAPLIYLIEHVPQYSDLTREVIDRATEIRSRYGFKTPDAIHLAAANLANCELFLTNDPRLNRFTELQIESLTA